MLHSKSTLRTLPVRAIIGAVAGAAQRWSDPNFPARVRAARAIGERTGYSEPVIDYALDRLFGPMTAAAIAGAITSELGSLDVLDGFVNEQGARRTARGLDRIVIVSSRTTLGVAIVPAIFALCAKSSIIVKDRSDALAGSFFATLIAERAEFEGAASARVWDGGHDEPETSLLARADAVVAFGSDQTLAAIRARLCAGARFIGYGDRLSAGYIAREALANESNIRAVARAAANDLVLYDTEGCLSLHMIFVEAGGAIDPRCFASIFADAVQAAALEFPRGRVNAGAQLALAAVRDRAAFAAANGAAAVHAPQDLSWLITVDCSRRWPPPLLPRACIVLPVREPGEALAYLQAHRLPLEGLALEPRDARPDVLSFTLESGAAQVRAAGALQGPAIHIRHGGRPRIAEFVRWIDAAIEEHQG